MEIEGNEWDKHAKCRYVALFVRGLCVGESTASLPISTRSVFQGIKAELTIVFTIERVRVGWWVEGFNNNF